MVVEKHTRLANTSDMASALTKRIVQANAFRKMQWNKITVLQFVGWRQTAFIVYVCQLPAINIQAQARFSA